MSDTFIAAPGFGDRALTAPLEDGLRVKSNATARVIAAAVLLPALLCAREVPAAGVSLELNRLEPLQGGCRMHLVLGNASPARYTGYQLDLVIFGGDGVVAQRITLDAAPLRQRKTSVYAFDVAGLPCTQFGRVLVNDILDCRTATGPVTDCVSAVSVSSRTGVELAK